MLTGLYPDRNGQTVSNSYDYYRNNGTPTFTSSFKYWTAPVDGADDSKPNMIADTGKNTPAPWAPFTRAGCDVGGVGTANIELENNSTAPGGDIANVYGNPSPEASETPRSERPTSSGSRSTAPRPWTASAPATRTQSRTCCRTSRAATSATRRSSGRSTSTRRSPAATPA